MVYFLEASQQGNKVTQISTRKVLELSLELKESLFVSGLAVALVHFPQLTDRPVYSSSLITKKVFMVAHRWLLEQKYWSREKLLGYVLQFVMNGRVTD